MNVEVLQARFVAWWLDGVLFFVPLVVGLVFAAKGEWGIGEAICFGVWFVSGPVNQVLLVGLVGQTFGKMLLGLHVRRAEDTTRTPGIFRAFLRTIVFFESPLVAGIAIWLSPRNQRLGDMLANTLVGIPLPIRAVAGDRADTNGVWLDLPAPDGRPSATVRSEGSWRAAWYGDTRDPDRLRWYDGSEMTEQTRSRELTAEDIEALNA